MPGPSECQARKEAMCNGNPDLALDGERGGEIGDVTGSLVVKPVEAVQ